MNFLWGWFFFAANIVTCYSHGLINHSTQFENNTWNKIVLKCNEFKNVEEVIQDVPPLEERKRLLAG